MNTNLRRLIRAALFAALTCVATMIIQIPSPMNGYVNLGDCLVLLSGWALGPLYGAAAAGLGSGLADVFTGYAYYAPGTFLIKALMAVLAWVIARRVGDLRGLRRGLVRTASAAAAELWMVLGYWGYAGLILGRGLAAAAGIPGNLVQGAFGAVSAALVWNLLTRNERVRRRLSDVR